MPDSEKTTQSTPATPELQKEQVSKPETVSETQFLTSSENAPLTQTTSPTEKPSRTDLSSIAVDEKPKDPYKKTWDRNRGHIREFKRKRHSNCKDPVKRPYKVWTEDEDKLLTFSYAKTTDAGAVPGQDEEFYRPACLPPEPGEDLKGKTLMFNPRTGQEYWLESRYPHSPDITNDSKLARQILRDLGIIEEKERKVDVTAHLKMLWEEEPIDEQEGKSGKEEPMRKSKAEPEAD